MPTGFYSDGKVARNDDGAHPLSKNNYVASKQNANNNNEDNDDSSSSIDSSSSSSVVATVTKSHEDTIEENNNSEEEDNDSSEEEQQQLIVGTSIVPLLTNTAQEHHGNDDDDKLSNNDTNNNNNGGEGSGRCWSCFVHLNNNNNNNNGGNNEEQVTTTTCHYTTHEHPLLSIPVCSICNERAEAVEGQVIDAKLLKQQQRSNGSIDNNDLDGMEQQRDDEEEVNACSWCGLTTLLEENDTSSHSSSSSSIQSPNKTIVGLGINPTQSSTIYLDNIPLGDGGSNELLLCDNCPRGMCVKCCTVSLGGTVEGLQRVRHVCNEGGEGGGEGGGEWKCCYCNPTEFLERLREEYRLVCGVSDNNDDGALEKKEEDSVMNVDDSGKDDDEGDNDEDTKIARLIDELNTAEDELATAQQMLSKVEIEQTRNEIESELLLNSSSSSSSSLGLEDLTDVVEEQLGDYLQKWQRTFDLCQNAIVQLQEELEEGGVQLTQFYKFRDEERKRLGLSGDEEDGSDYVRMAEMAMDKRDEEEGWNKGEFRGASGYKCPNAKIYKLEPEDLDNSNLNEIEDINTLQGAVSQMASNSKQELTSWRSKTGTTSDDIEMLKKKSVKCEERDLGGLIDLDKLEKNCIRDDDDIVEDHKVEMIIRSKKGGKTGSRVVKRSTSLYVRKKQAAKSKRRGRLSGDVKEYQPRAPPQPRPQQDGPPKAKKRAQLLTVSSSGTLSSGRSSPAIKGVLMGSELAKFEDSDVILEVAGCESQQVSVCRSLASTLKGHQKEGLQFCWKNVCHDILKPNQELYGGVRGAILAHNMGLGKSFQAVCLLHTLMTHPSLVRESRKGSTSSNRIVNRAILIAPVNTLANWEQEFKKWLGPNVPALRFFSWTEFQSKSKIIKEWYEEGGILCCSSDRYANACKGFLDTNDKGDEKDEKSTLSKDDAAFFRKALFNPGPDIVCLDEVHTMLKTSTSNIYKVLNGIGTKLRLALTGSPIQNNLFEYYRMASWARPESLGTEGYFEKTFANPIMDGMAADCSIFEAEWQERRTRELHDILSDFVHRRDSAVLQKELPYLQTAIIHVRQSKVQVKLYQDFRKYQKRTDEHGFFKQYHALRPVSNHPACLIGDAEKGSTNSDSPAANEEKEKPKVGGEELGDRPSVAPEKFAWICDICNKAKFRTFEEAVEHENNCTGTFDADTTSPGTHAKSSPTKETDNSEWWRPFADKAQKNGFDINAIENGGKIVLLLQIIAHCDLIGDKVVVFSQCLSTLTFIEGIIQSDDWGGFKPHLPNNICQQKLGGWKRNYDYVRIDGSVDAKERGDLISSFNSSDNQHTRLFLLSTKAGGLGVNLVAANRVVLFDSHWNPAVDLQAVYRCYRYGQTKPTYCYRLLGEGSMEEKIYSRAATKASLSDLVIDQKNPARSFTKKELDLLQHENTWLCCEWCSKWRMLPPGLTAEQVEQQTSMDVWCCDDNIYDEDRKCCEAKERDQNWMLNYWEKRARQEAGINSQSQSQSQNEEASNELLPPNSNIDEKHEEKTERDEVLQALLSRTEEKRSASTKGTNNSPNKSSSSMSWVSKYSFQKEKSADDESKIKAAKDEAAAVAPKTKTPSPKKKRASSPKKSRKSTSAKNGKSPSKSGKSSVNKKGESTAKKNDTSPSKKNGVSPSRIEKYLSQKKNGSSASVKAERLMEGDRKRRTPFKSSEGSTGTYQASSKKQKQKDDVIDLCDSD